MSYYSDKLKDGRWQKLAAEVKEKADWKCQRCGTDTKNGIRMEAHHRRYLDGAEPWEYSIQELECLCEHCHELAHAETAASSEMTTGTTTRIVLCVQRPDGKFFTEHNEGYATERDWLEDPARAWQHRDNPSIPHDKLPRPSWYLGPRHEDIDTQARIVRVKIEVRWYATSQ